VCKATGGNERGTGYTDQLSTSAGHNVERSAIHPQMGRGMQIRPQAGKEMRIRPQMSQMTQMNANADGGMSGREVIQYQDEAYHQASCLFCYIRG
jgi:hypothetical protein